jgi:uncharacterized protein YqgQ
MKWRSFESIALLTYIADREDDIEALEQEIAELQNKIAELEDEND